MRIVTGKYKGRHFEIPRTFKARPTTDFAKENLFNVLRGYTDIEGKDVLDLFAGTGSITAEFLSRGSHFVSSVELDREHCAFIASVLRTLGADNARLHRYDALRYITHSSDAYDIIFADPPYKLPRLGEIPSLVLSSPILRPDGLLILEHGKNYDFSALPGFFDHRAYGSVNFSFFRHPAPAAE
jgi:16S rRNA (guanine(966)-N(2))-methyltransferase RsmD